MRARTLVMALLAVVLSSTASADIPDLPYIDTHCDPCADVFVSPAGTAPTLADQGCVVHVRIRDGNAVPIAGYPFQDLWLDDIGNGDLSVCAGGSVADANTDANGETTLSGAMSAGGWTQAGLYLYVAGNPDVDEPLAIDVNSPDLDADLDVDLGDLGAFAMAYVQGTYDFSVDFNHDGKVNLGDVGTFALHFHDACP